MATWQYDLFLLPRYKVVERYHGIPRQISDEDFASVKWWFGVEFPANGSTLLDSIKPPFESWNKNVLAWGDERSDYIEVFIDHGKVEEIFVRVDAGKLERDFAKQITYFAKLCVCLIYLPDSGKIIEPEEPNLHREIISSRAYRFVTDPDAFLEELEKNQLLCRTQIVP